MNDDTLARARRVVEAIGAKGPRYVEAPQLDALIALAEAAARFREARRASEDEWAEWRKEVGAADPDTWLETSRHDYCESWCIGCYSTGDHAPDCPALAIDAALARLAAQDDGEVG